MSFNKKKLNSIKRFGVKIVHTGSEYYKDRQGIHLFNPLEIDLNDVLEVAQRDNFKIIWCHWDNVLPIEAYDFLKKTA